MTHATSWTIFFEPLDVLVFRDHRPFDAGHHFFAGSRFPLPSVCYGALRAALFQRAGAHFSAHDDHFGVADRVTRRLAGSRRAPGELTIEGPLLARRVRGEVEPLFPWPRDLVRTRDGHVSRVRPTAVGDDVRCFRGSSRGTLCRYGGDLPLAAEAGKPGWAPLLTPSGARRYLGGTDVAFGPGDQCDAGEIYRLEPRTGIARDAATGVAGESMIYGLETWRFADRCGLAVAVAVPDPEVARTLAALDDTIVQLGGKGHRAAIHVHERPLLIGLGAETDSSVDPRRPLGAWFLTPALLDPAELDPVEVRCVIGERTALGGFDLARHRPRPLAPALGRGGVVLSRLCDARVLRARLDGLQRAREAITCQPVRAGYGLYRLFQQPD